MKENDVFPEYYIDSILLQLDIMERFDLKSTSLLRSALGLWI